jgi:hypothetical protein
MGTTDETDKKGNPYTQPKKHANGSRNSNSNIVVVIKRDNYYNKKFNPTTKSSLFSANKKTRFQKEASTNKLFEKKNVEIIPRIRERIMNKDLVEDLLKKCLMNGPLLPTKKKHIFLVWFGLYKTVFLATQIKYYDYILEKKSFTDNLNDIINQKKKKLSIRERTYDQRDNRIHNQLILQPSINKGGIINKDVYELVTIAEKIFLTIFPGIYRISIFFDEIVSCQSRLYTKAFSYIEFCKRNRAVVNWAILTNIIQINNNEWNALDIDNWITDTQWIKYLQMVVRSYILFSVVVNVLQREPQRRENINKTRHVVGLLYTLQRGLMIKKYLGNIMFDICVIPQDMYMSKHGVLLKETKVWKFCEEVKDQSDVENGIVQFKNFIEKSLTLLNPIQIIRAIFSKL